MTRVSTDSPCSFMSLPPWFDQRQALTPAGYETSFPAGGGRGGSCTSGRRRRRGEPAMWRRSRQKLVPRAGGSWPWHRRYGGSGCEGIGSSPHVESASLRSLPWQGRSVGSVEGVRPGPGVRGSSPRQEAVLHGEQCGGGPGGNTDLPVGVLDVAGGGGFLGSQTPP